MIRLIHSLAQATAQMTSAAVDSPALDARLLVGHALGLDRAEMLSQAERELTPAEIHAIEKLIARRATHESVARIIGEREFWSLPFGLNEATLEPRPDSETLVEAALKKLSLAGRVGATQEMSHRDGGAPPPLTPPARGGDIKILDLGTGTGCLLLSLLHERTHATGLGIDIAPRAVEQARTNAERLGLAGRVEFRTGDWFDGIGDTFDAIISNPPYIPAGEIADLMPEVRAYDPLRALDGGADGLDIYRFLIPQVPRFLKPEGFVIFEVGQGQAHDVAALCRESGLTSIEIFKDLGGIERCVLGMA